jgi:ribosomal protein S18 acetylase RimI-like enzyme
MNEVEIGEPASNKEFEEYYDLRWKVLRMPWGKEKGSEKDESDEKSVHLAAFAGRKIVGVGRFYFVSEDKIQIRSMAVMKEYERRGIGSRILKEIEERAAHQGAKYAVLDARENALDFYKKKGYEIKSKSYLLFGTIQHWRMEKKLMEKKL